MILEQLIVDIFMDKGNLISYVPQQSKNVAYWNILAESTELINEEAAIRHLKFIDLYFI